jgi:hypothetical protein
MVKFYNAVDGIHKYVAEFNNPYQRVPFGDLRYDDFTTHGDPMKKKSYLARHRTNEDWENPRTAGALSRWILWNKATLSDSIIDYINRFNMNYE